MIRRGAIYRQFLGLIDPLQAYMNSRIKKHDVINSDKDDSSSNNNLNDDNLDEYHDEVYV